MAWMVSSIFGDYLNDEWGFWTAGMVYAYYRVHSLAAVSEAATDAQESARAHTIAPARPRQVTP
jgi:hypothetical protein